MNEFIWPVRVYYEDTDAGGVVYHSHYLNFMERARSEWLRSLGFQQTELRTHLGVLFVVRQLSIQYRRPAQFDDQLQVHSRLRRLGRSLLEFEQRIQRGEQVLTEATVEVVCIDAQRFKPVSMPDTIRNTMQPLAATITP